VRDGMDDRSDLGVKAMPVGMRTLARRANHFAEVTLLSSSPHA